MSEQTKTEPSCGEYSGGVPWYPLRKWWQSGRLFNQNIGLPPFLEPGDLQWTDVDRLQRSLAACFWPGYIPAPLFVPYIFGSMRHPNQKISEAQYQWRVSLEVAHFFPSEISVSVRDGFLEVRGKHEERPDEHGFIARGFTRKYRLPDEIDVTKIISILSVDGILTVEAPVSETSVPAAIIIPIKVELEATGEKQEKQGVPDTDPDSCKASEAQAILSAEDEGEEESPLEDHGDQAHPGSVTAGLEQHEERREQEEERREQEEETQEKPDSESGPSAPIDGEGTESLQDSPQHKEAQEVLYTEPSKQPEDTGAVMDGEIQVMAGPGEAAEEMSHPEELEMGKSPLSELPSQELEASSITQEHTE